MSAQSFKKTSTQSQCPPGKLENARVAQCSARKVLSRPILDLDHDEVTSLDVGNAHNVINYTF